MVGRGWVVRIRQERCRDLGGLPKGSVISWTSDTGVVVVGVVGVLVVLVVLVGGWNDAERTATPEAE